MSKIIPTLFLGLGGTGFYAISEIKKTIASKYFQDDPDFPLNAYLAIDTEFITADKIEKIQDTKDADEIEFITTFDSTNIKDIERIETPIVPDGIKAILKDPGSVGLEDFVPEGASEFIEVKGDGASGVGLVGKIALAINFSSVTETIKRIIDSLMDSDAVARLKINPLFSNYDREERMNVYIFCSFGGGTGKGMALIITALLKELLNHKFHGQRNKYNISVINYLPACFRSRGRSVANDESTYQYILKNQYATYKEFDWCMTHGYKNENFFRTYFNKTTNTKTDDFINCIYNISPNLEDSGTKVSSYSSINKIVAETFTFLVMNPESYSIIQSLSNETQQLQSAISEKGTGLIRNRKYCRIGRFNIILPEKELFDFATSYFAQVLLKDFLQGGIDKEMSYSALVGPEGDLDNKPIELSRKKSNEIINIFEDHYRNCPQLNSGELYYPDVQNFQLSSFINPILSQIQSFESIHTGFERSENLLTAKSIIDDFTQITIRNSGLLFARDFLKELNTNIELLIHESLERIQEKNDFGVKELLKGLGDQDEYAGTIEVDEFEFRVIEGVLGRLRVKVEEGIIQLSEFTSPEKFSHVSEIIDSMRKPKKVGWLRRIFSFIFKIVEDDRMFFPEDAKAIVYKIISDFNKNLQKVWPVFIAKELLIFTQELNRHINHRFDKINDFIDLLSNAENERAAYVLNLSSKKIDHDGLLNRINREIMSKSHTSCEANESNIIGDNDYEFKLFAKSVLPYETIISDLHQRFNLDIVDHLFSARIRAISDDLYYLTIKSCHERLEKERINQDGTKKWTILNYMHFLLSSQDVKARQQIEENLLKLKRRSKFLSAIDLNKFESPGSAVSSFPQHNYLEISDESFLPKYIKGWEEYTHRSKIIPQENDERITLNRIQGLIPLFAFSDLQEAQKLYNKSLNSSDSVKDKQRFKVMTHSSAYFMSGIDEPFGHTLQIDKSDAINIWNMAFHLGIVAVSENDYVKITDDPFSDEFTYYESPSLRQFKNKANRRVRIRDYHTNFMEYFHLTTTIKDLLFERVNSIAAHSMEGKAVLKKYYIDKSYPIIPKVLFDVIINKLDTVKYKELVYFTQLVEQEYLGVFESIADSRLRNRKLAFNESELQKIYKGSTQHLEFFNRILSETSAASRESEEIKSKKIEKTNPTTKWLIIIERDKNSSIGSDYPQDWETIEKIYTSLDPAPVTRNLYAPDINLIINHEEFTELTRRFILENEIRSLGLDPSVLESSYLVASTKMGKSRLLSKKKLKLDTILKILEEDNSIMLSEDEKPKLPEDWKPWKSIEAIDRIFDYRTNSKDDEEIVLPI
jgi:hypothetical protein